MKKMTVPAALFAALVIAFFIGKHSHQDSTSTVRVTHEQVAESKPQPKTFSTNSVDDRLKKAGLSQESAVKPQVSE